MADKNHVQPPFTIEKYRSVHDHSHFSIMEPKERRRRNCVIYCGFITALILVISTVMLAFNFTVFHIQDPKLKLNSLTITGLERVSNATLLPGSVVSVIADVSIENPNFASFKFYDASIVIYYGGAVVGQGGHPPGAAKSKGTLRMNVTINVVAEKIFDVPRFKSDRSAGFLPMSSYSSVSGKVKMLNVNKKEFEVRMNCTMSYSISKQVIQDEACTGFLAL